MSASVIICAYTLDRWSDLVAAVESCVNQTRPPGEIILVIDYNEDLERKSREEFANVVVVANTLSKGLSGARNTGVLVASGDVLVFLDDDAYAAPTWLQELLAPLEDENVAGSGGWIVPHWPSTPPAWFPPSFLWVLGCSYEGLPSDGSEIRNPIGASMAIRRDVFRRVGGFTAGIGRVGTVPLGCEETELCIRYTQQRPEHRFVLARGALVHHRVPPSRLTTKYFLSRCWAEGLSKAAVSTLVGAHNGLSAERRHLMGAIPRDALSAVGSLRADPRNAAKRLALTVLGSLVAAGGLVRGTLAVRRTPLHVEPVILDDGSALGDAQSSGATAWRPIAIRGVDVEGPHEAIHLPEGYDERVWLEARRGGQVVGRDERRAFDGMLSAAAVTEFAAGFADVSIDESEVRDDELPRFTVVVPTICQNPSELAATVERLVAMEYPDFDVVVVDNRVRADDSFPDFSDQARVRVVSERVPGISAARNRGIRESTSEFVAFTDDDVSVDPQWLRALGRRFVLSPEVDAVGGLVLPRELATAPQLWFEEFFGGFSQSFTLDICDSSSHPEDPLFPYAPGRFGAGCNMAFRRSVLERLGGFRAELGTGTPARGGEDLAAFVDAILSGATVAFEPAALVRHSHRATEDGLERQVFGYGVGLAAFYTYLLTHHPRHVVRMLSRVPAAVGWFTRSRSPLSPAGTSHYPRHLRTLQLRGILSGPLAYARSVIAQRRNPTSK